MSKFLNYFLILVWLSILFTLPVNVYYNTTDWADKLLLILIIIGFSGQVISERIEKLY